MEMTNRVPDWVTPIAWVFLALAVASAAWIAYDVYVRRHRRDTVAAEVVWISSALYLGPLAVPLYRRYARPAGSPSTGTVAGTGSGAVAGLPGGSASAVAHLIGVPLVVASGLTIAGIDLWVMILVIGAIAIALLTAYERLAGTASGAASGRAGRRKGLGTAFVVATVTVLAFDLGMGGWMLLLHYNELMPPATDASFWFLMQLGVLLGLATGYPVVRRLAASGTARPA